MSQYPQTVNEFFREVRAGNVKFPYKRGSTTDDEIMAMFDNLRNYTHEGRLKEIPEGKLKTPFRNLAMTPEFLALTGNLHWNNGPPTVLTYDEEDYEAFNQLGDMFTEDLRMRAKLRFAKETPEQYFERFPKKVAEKAIADYGGLNPESVREAIYDLSRECTSHRPNIIIALMQILLGTPGTPGVPGAIDVLDFSAGWGDRLIGAIAGGARYYCGVDPHIELHERYEQIAAFFEGAEGNATQVETYASGAESFDFEGVVKNKPFLAEKGGFDLVYSSPPYFNFESYVHPKSPSGKMQSSRFNSESDWFNKFLSEAVFRAWKVTRPGGYFAININHSSNKEKYVIWLLRMFNGFQHSMENPGDKHVARMRILDAEFVGTLPYANRELKNPQPIFVWRKKIADTTN